MVVNCPKCNTGQFIEEWGTKICKFENCGHSFEVPYNPELLLIEVLKLKKDFDELMQQLSKIRSTKLKPAKLQKYPTGGWVLVPQGYE